MPLKTSFQSPPYPSFQAHCKCLWGMKPFRKMVPKGSNIYLPLNPCASFKAYIFTYIRFYCSCHSQSSSRYKNNKSNNFYWTLFVHSLNKLSFRAAMSGTSNTCFHFIPVTIFWWRHCHLAVELREVKKLVWNYPPGKGESQVATLGQTDCKSCTLPTGPPDFLNVGMCLYFLFPKALGTEICT